MNADKLAQIDHDAKILIAHAQQLIDKVKTEKLTEMRHNITDMKKIMRDIEFNIATITMPEKIK